MRVNLLIVDDQKNVIDGIRNGVCWQRLPVRTVFTAESAGEAKRVLTENEINIMLCDIEMPGEDGLSLFRWAKEYNSRVEGVFLTSHAEFEYAKEALHLGGLDYILQPAPYSEIEEAILSACEKIDRKTELYRFSEYGRRMFSHKASEDGAAEKEVSEEGYVDSVIQYIHSNIGKDLRRSELAEVVNLNEDYLSRIFKKETGMSLKEYILLEKMRTAQNLLRGTSFTVGMISSRVGFDNFSHFSQTYKKIMKRTPAEEREQLAVKK